MLKKVKKRTIRDLFSYGFKRKKFLPIVKLSRKPIFKSEGYWVAQQLLNRGYLDHAHEVIQHLPYKKHFDYIIHRIESMIEIRNNGFTIEKIEKKSIEKINLLFAVHNSFPYDKAGYAIRTDHIATILQSQGLNLRIATRPGYPWDLQKHRELEGREQYNRISGVNYIRLSDNNKTFKKGADSDYISVYADELVKVAKQNNVTVIHAHSNYLNGLAGIQAADRLGIPSVFEIRGLWHKTRVTLDADYKHAGMFEYESTMKKAAIQAADAVVTISNPLKDLIVSWGANPDKIHVVPNAVDTTLFTPRSPSVSLVEKYQLQGKTVVGFIGSLTGYEGLKELVLAVNELIAEGLDIVLMIVGDGREKANLERLTKSTNIIFTGRVPFEEVEEYYTLFDICPFPRNNFEICRYVPPLKILEAMAMEKAIIISDVAPLLEIIENGKNGLVCKADNLESLKTSILQLYQDISLRERLGKKAREWVEANRSWNDASEKYIKLYNSFKDSHV